MEITFLFYDGMTALDVIGPYEILTRLPQTTVQRVSLQPGLIKTCAGLQLMAEKGLSEVTKTDVLVIPGGGHAPALREYPELLAWIKKIHHSTVWTTSVCTGSLILGAAGLLSGIKATTHWAVMDRLKTWGAIPVSKRVVEDGKIMTAAGVSAGIDMAFTLAAKLAGERVAKDLQLGLEYDPVPPFDCGSPNKVPEAIVAELHSRLLKKFESA